MLQFLRDYRTQLAEGIAKTVFQGNTVEKNYLDEVAFKCGVMEDIETLDADDINKFYGVEIPEEKEKPNGQ